MSQYSLDACLATNCSFPYNGGEINTSMRIMTPETACARPVGKSEILEEGTEKSGLYMPMLYESQNIQIDHPLEITIGGEQKSYPVCGFFNNTMLGSHNCLTMELMLTEDLYRELSASSSAVPATLCSVRLQVPQKNQDFEADLKARISETFPHIPMVSITYDMVSQSRYISQTVSSGMISALAFLTLLIALAVLSSNIRSFIRENMQNLGAQKAIGYTSSQLMCAMTLQYLLVVAAAAAVGLGLSYLIFPSLNQMMVSQTGIPYAVRFLPIPTLLTIVIPCLVMGVTVWLSCLKIRKITPILALRQGMPTHSFRKNHLPLEKSSQPVNLSLSLKTALGNLKQGVTVSVTMLLLSIICVFCAVMVKNQILNPQPFIDMIAGETTDSMIGIESTQKDRFDSFAKENPQVEKYYLYQSQMVSHDGKAELWANICDDFSQVNNQSVCYAGRFPQYKNEIAMTAGGKKAVYLITGFNQGCNNLGKDCLITQEGYPRMGQMDNLCYCLNLTEETDIDAFNKTLSETLPTTAAANIQKAISGSMEVYTCLMTMIVAAMIIITLIIAAFVIFFLVRMLLSGKKKEYGVLKALGYTTGQLIFETAFSFMPSILLSAAIGHVISYFTINPLVSIFLKGIGIAKANLQVPLDFTIFSALALTVCAFLIACLMSLKIRKITPKELLAGE